MLRPVGVAVEWAAMQRGLCFCLFLDSNPARSAPNRYKKNQQPSYYYFSNGFAVTFILNNDELLQDGRTERAKAYWSNSDSEKRW